MALTQIGRNSTASITLNLGGGLKTYNCQFSRFDTRAVCPPIESTTFCNETNPTIEPGQAIMIITFAGLVKKGIDGSNGAAVLGDLLGNPYDVSGTWQYDVGCSIQCDAWAFEDVTGSRVAGGNAVFAGTARSDGTYVIAWVEA